jgi:pimeloyl-ACP methyl ester carboxylesterase
MERLMHDSHRERAVCPLYTAIGVIDDRWKPMLFQRLSECPHGVQAIRALLMLLVCLAHASSATAQSAPTTRTVDVDGVALRVLTARLESRKPGQPVVVFESGGSAPLETWDVLMPRVAAFAPVVAYDRSGTGSSPWDGQPPTPERIATRLRGLLNAMRVEPPFLLVGHSWGGALIRYFAAAFPRDVAGVVSLDPTDITLTRGDMLALFTSIGGTEADFDTLMAVQKKALAAAPSAMRAEAAVIMGLLDTPPAQRTVLDRHDVPTSVIVAGRVGVPPQSALPFDTKAYANAMHRNQVTRLRSWVKNGGMFDIAADSGHMVHRDAVDMVVAEIRRLLQLRR